MFFGGGTSPPPKKNDFFFIIFFLVKKKSNFFLWNVLKRMKNQFSNFYFSSYGNFCTQNMVNFRWIFTHSSKNKNRQKNVFRFSFYSAHSTSFIKIWPLLRGVGLHILSWEKVETFNGTKRICDFLIWFLNRHNKKDQCIFNIILSIIFK